MSRRSDPSGVRQRLAEARLLLVFTPALVPIAADSATDIRSPPSLAAAAPWLGLVQVRPNALGGGGAVGDVTEARAARDWTLAVLEALERAGFAELPVIVNDRVDVAALLAERGVAGVHVGADDTPPEVARRVLGTDALIGLSTHSMRDVTAAEDAPIDLVGVGPVFASATKGYGVTTNDNRVPRVQGPERAWIAAEASVKPLFPIGGIDRANIDEPAEADG